MKLFNRLNLILNVALICILILTAAYSYTYWDKKYLDYPLGFYVDEFTESSNVFDGLPPNTPQYVIDRLEQLAENNPPQVIEALVEAIRDIVNSPEFEGGIHAAGSVEGFFEDGNLPILPGDILVYTSKNDDGAVSFSIIYVNSSSSYQITSLDRLYEALSLTWTGVNKISNTWIRGNTYSTLNSPLHHDGRYYLMYFGGPSGTPPTQDRNTWFQIMPNLEYNTQNRYFKNYIVYRHNQYYIANQYATWAAPSPNPQPWEPWTVISAYSPASYSSGQVVHTGSGDSVRFWLALTQTSLMPNEESARAGQWREINNGWIGTSEGETANIIKPYYFEHNTYFEGDTVIFGITPKLWYRYYRAKGNVPSGQKPIMVDEFGVSYLNEEYWTMVYYEA